MYKACSKCGKIHAYNYICETKRRFSGGEERKLRSRWSWTQKSKEIREKANYLCEVCKAQGIITYDDIEVHHITKVKDDESLLLDNYNLICLCAPCHYKADHNQIDQHFLKELARQREEDTGGGWGYITSSQEKS